MIHKKLQTFLSLALLVSPVLSQAAPAAAPCPEQIQPMQTLDQSPAGWTALSERSPSRLVNASFYDGHPELQAEFAPGKSLY